MARLLKLIQSGASVHKIKQEIDNNRDYYRVHINHGLEPNNHPDATILNIFSGLDISQRKDDIAVVKLLLELGADPNIRPLNTPFLRALGAKKWTLALYLCMCSNNESKLAALHALCKNANNQEPSTIISLLKALLISGIDPLSRDIDGKTPLDYLRSNKEISHDTKKTMAALIQAEIEKMDIQPVTSSVTTNNKEHKNECKEAALSSKNNETALLRTLIAAIRRQNVLEATQLLEDKNYHRIINFAIQDDTTNETITALSEAAKLPPSQNNVTIIKSLLAIEGIDLNQVSGMSLFTPLCYALSQKYLNESSIGLLLDAKANPLINNKYGIDAIKILARIPKVDKTGKESVSFEELRTRITTFQTASNSTTAEKKQDNSSATSLTSSTSSATQPAVVTNVHATLYPAAATQNTNERNQSDKADMKSQSPANSNQ